MRKHAIGIALMFTALAHVPAHACVLYAKSTMYFGKQEMMTPALEKKIKVDIASTNTQTFDDFPRDPYQHVIFIRNNVLYLNGEPSDWNIGSFRYLGRGNYLLRGEIYYKGQLQGAYPQDAKSDTFDEERADNPPPGSYGGCAVPSIDHVLSLSNGQRYVHNEQLAS